MVAVNARPRQPRSNVIDALTSSTAPPRWETCHDAAAADEAELLAQATRLFLPRPDGQEGRDRPGLRLGEGLGGHRRQRQGLSRLSSRVRCAPRSATNHPRIVAAIKEACDTMLHAHSSHYNVKEIQLAARLGALMPDPLQKSLFGESGSDANEMAVMIARKIHRRLRGRQPTYQLSTAISDATRAPDLRRLARRSRVRCPAAPTAIVAPYCYRCPPEPQLPQCEFACLKTSFALLDAAVDRQSRRGDHRAAVQRRRRHRAAAGLAEALHGALP